MKEDTTTSAATMAALGHEGTAGALSRCKNLVEKLRSDIAHEDDENYWASKLGLTKATTTEEEGREGKEDGVNGDQTETRQDATDWVSKFRSEMREEGREGEDVPVISRVDNETGQALTETEEETREGKEDGTNGGKTEIHQDTADWVLKFRLEMGEDEGWERKDKPVMSKMDKETRQAVTETEEEGGECSGELLAAVDDQNRKAAPESVSKLLSLPETKEEGKEGLAGREDKETCQEANDWFSKSRLAEETGKEGEQGKEEGTQEANDWYLKPRLTEETGGGITGGQEANKDCFSELGSTEATGGKESEGKDQACQETNDCFSQLGLSEAKNERSKGNEQSNQEAYDWFSEPRLREEADKEGGEGKWKATQEADDWSLQLGSLEATRKEGSDSDGKEQAHQDVNTWLSNLGLSEVTPLMKETGGKEEMVGSIDKAQQEVNDWFPKSGGEEERRTKENGELCEASGRVGNDIHLVGNRLQDFQNLANDNGKDSTTEEQVETEGPLTGLVELYKGNSCTNDTELCQQEQEDIKSLVAKHTDAVPSSSRSKGLDRVKDFDEDSQLCSKVPPMAAGNATARVLDSTMDQSMTSPRSPTHTNVPKDVPDDSSRTRKRHKLMKSMMKALKKLGSGHKAQEEEKKPSIKEEHNSSCAVQSEGTRPDTSPVPKKMRLPYDSFKDLSNQSSKNAANQALSVSSQAKDSKNGTTDLVLYATSAKKITNCTDKQVRGKDLGSKNEAALQMETKTTAKAAVGVAKNGGMEAKQTTNEAEKSESNVKTNCHKGTVSDVLSDTWLNDTPMDDLEEVLNYGSNALQVVDQSSHFKKEVQSEQRGMPADLHPIKEKENDIQQPSPTAEVPHNEVGLAMLEENSKMILQQFASLKSVFEQSQAQSTEILKNVFDTSWSNNAEPSVETRSSSSAEKASVQPMKPSKDRFIDLASIKQKDEIAEQAPSATTVSTSIEIKNHVEMQAGGPGELPEEKTEGSNANTWDQNVLGTMKPVVNNAQPETDCADITVRKKDMEEAQAVAETSKSKVNELKQKEVDAQPEHPPICKQMVDNVMPLADKPVELILLSLGTPSEKQQDQVEEPAAEETKNEQGSSHVPKAGSKSIMRKTLKNLAKSFKSSEATRKAKKKEAEIAGDRQVAAPMFKSANAKNAHKSMAGLFERKKKMGSDGTNVKSDGQVDTKQTTAEAEEGGNNEQTNEHKGTVSDAISDVLLHSTPLDDVKEKLKHGSDAVKAVDQARNSEKETISEQRDLFSELCPNIEDQEMADNHLQEPMPPSEERVNEIGLATLEDNGRMILQNFASLKNVFEQSRAQSTELLQSVFDTPWSNDAMPSAGTTIQSSSTAEKASMHQMEPFKDRGIDCVSKEQKIELAEQALSTTTVPTPTHVELLSDLSREELHEGRAEGTNTSKLGQTVLSTTKPAMNNENIQIDSADTTVLQKHQEEAKAAATLEAAQTKANEVKQKKSEARPEDPTTSKKSLDDATPSADKPVELILLPLGSPSEKQQVQVVTKTKPTPAETKAVQSLAEPRRDPAPAETHKEPAGEETRNEHGASPATKAEPRTVVGKTVEKLAMSFQSGETSADKKAATRKANKEEAEIAIDDGKDATPGHEGTKKSHKGKTGLVERKKMEYFAGMGSEAGLEAIKNLKQTATRAEKNAPIIAAPFKRKEQKIWSANAQEQLVHEHQLRNEPFAPQKETEDIGPGHTKEGKIAEQEAKVEEPSITAKRTKNDEKKKKKKDKEKKKKDKAAKKERKRKKAKEKQDKKNKKKDGKADSSPPEHTSKDTAKGIPDSNPPAELLQESDPIKLPPQECKSMQRQQQRCGRRPSHSSFNNQGNSGDASRRPERVAKETVKEKPDPYPPAKLPPSIDPSELLPQERKSGQGQQQLQGRGPSLAVFDNHGMLADPSRQSEIGVDPRPMNSGSRTRFEQHSSSPPQQHQRGRDGNPSDFLATSQRDGFDRVEPRSGGFEANSGRSQAPARADGFHNKCATEPEEYLQGRLRKSQKKSISKRLSWSEDVRDKKTESVIWWSASKDAVEVLYEEDDKSTESEGNSSAESSTFSSYPTACSDDQTLSFDAEPQIDFSFSTLKEVTESLVEEAALIRQEIKEAGTDVFREAAIEIKATASNLAADTPGVLRSWFKGGAEKKQGGSKRHQKKKKRKSSLAFSPLAL